MTDVKWIKIVTDIFDDEKIVLIDAMPERDAVLVIWFKLLCLAGKQNNGGVFLFSGKMPFTDEMLALVFRRPINTVRFALNIFEQFGMVEIVNSVYTIPNWEKYQEQAKLEEFRENGRKRVAAYRERQKLMAQGENSNVTVIQSNNGEENNIDEKEDLDNKNEIIKQIVDSYHQICKSFSRVSCVTDKRISLLNEGLKRFSFDDYIRAFEKAESSIYLKGNNKNGWKANFSWIIDPNNMVKILEGVYDERTIPQSNNNGHQMGQMERQAIQRILSEQ